MLGGLPVSLLLYAGVAVGAISLIGYVHHHGRVAGKNEVRLEIERQVASANTELRKEAEETRAELAVRDAERARLEAVAVAKGLAVKNDVLVLPDDVVERINQIGRRR